MEIIYQIAGSVAASILLSYIFIREKIVRLEVEVANMKEQHLFQQGINRELKIAVEALNVTIARLNAIIEERNA